MRTKVTSGLVATNADGSPSVRPPMPSGWCRSTFIPEAGSELDGIEGVGESGDTSLISVPNMSSDGIPLREGDQRSNDGAYDVIVSYDSCTNNVREISNGDENAPSYDTMSEIENPSPAQHDPSHLSHANPNSNPNVPETENAANSNSSTPFVPHDLREEVSADISVEDVGDVDKEIDVECNPVNHSGVRSYVQPSMNVTSLEKSCVSRGENPSNNLSDEMDRQGVSNSTHQITNVISSQMDSVSMTIASVAAGEGEPPAFLMMERSGGNGFPSTTQNTPTGRHKKSKSNTSASARLPVISSLLAPPGASPSRPGDMASHATPLPGIQHIASGNTNSSSPTTVLPSVAHFLGPAKSPPTAYTPHQASPDLYHQSLSAPSVGTEANRPGSSKSKNNRKAVTPAGLRLSMAASAELPDPLPLPQYSDKVLRAKQMGTIAFDRPTVLRETVQFFLQFKHYWSSHDYDRISNLVVELFPEFKDSETPGVPVNKRIRTDLSMYARNFRRREVSQRKKDGSGGPPGVEGAREPRLDGGSPTDGVKSFLHSPPSTAGSMSSNNPSNFCNELLTAASIIESQTSSAVGKNDEMRSQAHNNNNHHHHHSSNSHNAKSAKVPIQPLKHDIAGDSMHEPGMEDDDDDTPIHFMYDREAMSANPGRDATTAWQIYSDQVAQVMGAGGNVSQDYGLPEVWFPHGAGFKKENQEVVSLPEPLPIPDYSPKIQTAREDGTVSKHRSEIIRETARFYLGLKYWWSSADYTRISELVVQHFPGLKDDNTPDGMNTFVRLNHFRRIQRDLSMCARNLRRSKKPRRDRDSLSSHSGLDATSGIIHAHHPKKPKISKQTGEKRVKKSGKSKKNKTMVPVTAVVSEPTAATSVNEDMAAAAALLQQQYMQSSSPYHPSAHLLPSSHLLPSLQTHPALHEQQMQLNSSLLQQQQQQLHPQVGIDESGKGMVKEEPGPNSMEQMEQEPSPGMKSNPMTPMQKAPTPTLESVHSEAQEVARALARAAPNNRELEAQAEKMEQEKISHQQQVVAQNSMKVYQDPDHGNDLQERFAGLWRKGKFFDASLGVANKKLHVHKLVLLAMSPYLQETFKNADPRSQLEVNLPSDTTYETAKAFLKYIYEGILEVDTSSVRSLHKIATMLQMSKLAQYCQNFAQQLHEAAENANSAVQGEIPKISVNLGDLAELQAAQRQKILEAQAIQRLGDTNTINSSDLHQRTHASRYHVADEHAQLKAEYMTSHNQGSNEAGLVNTPNFLNQEALAQHRALIAATASVQSSTTDLPPSSLLLTSSHDPATQQLLHATLARNSSSTSASASQYHHHHPQQQQPQLAVQNDNSALLHRLTSETSASSSANSLDQQQQRLALAYWQAHTFGEIVSRTQVDPNFLSPAELASVAAAEDQRHTLSSLGHEVKLKSERDRHTKEWDGQADGVHQATMLPETCLPVDMARSHQVANAEGT